MAALPLLCLFLVASLLGNPVGPLQAVETAMAMFDGEPEAALQILSEVCRVRPEFPLARLNYGSLLLKRSEGLNSQAREHLVAAVDLYKAALVTSLLNLGLSYISSEEYPLAINAFQQGLAIAPRADIHNHLGLVYLSLKKFELARNCFEKAVEKDPLFASAHFNLALASDRLGNTILAAKHYWEATQLDFSFAEAWLNLAALHHKHNGLKEAIRFYKNALSSAVPNGSTARMAQSNLALAIMQSGNLTESVDRLRTLAAQAELKPREKHTLDMHLLRAMGMSCDWKERDAMVQRVVNQVHEELQWPLTDQLSVQPFDALLLPFPPLLRLAISRSHSDFWAQKVTVSAVPAVPTASPLKVAYMSYDFNEHPTAHLAEGLFRHHRRHLVRPSAVSFGKDDSSEYRRAIEDLADPFLDIAALDDEASISAVRTMAPHVLFDQQAHTKGSRPLLVASRLAPVQVNHLVFAGTMAASYIDYFISDRTVLPVERSRTFSEKLVVHPGTYQVNYYPSAPVLDGAGIRRAVGQRIVFANFNKLGKMEPASFRVWMNVLRRVPNSELWLLEDASVSAQRTISANLRAEAVSCGIYGERISFLKRVHKQEHVKRHQDVDLFLDSFTYGAHSTATDALRGTLPVLTLEGEVFSARVGSSLLHAFDSERLHTLLTTHSCRDFEHVAVLYASHPPLARRLRELVVKRLSIENPLFDTGWHVRKLEDGQRAMWELFQLAQKPGSHHICFAKEY